MERFETEEQQIEAIKRFWKENGTVIILGAVLGLGGLWGWRYYNDSVISAKESASQAYQTSLSSFAETEDIQALSAFVNDNSDTGYAALAAMIVAQQAVLEDDFETAKAQLSVAAKGKSEIADVAKLRLAKVHVQLAEYEQAISQLETVNAPAFADQVNELKGDVLYAQGAYDEARAAYNLALVELPGNQTIKMKLDNIAYARTQAVSSNSEQ
ncbi:YfgM family protein [Glaciecola siphonariae]|uniref:Ancillary SecYEG translocon subunit n=1 Tax=Glaciecola siphonariae TaxID=521012 RepID=A0ABV9M111_9ALTE